MKQFLTEQEPDSNGVLTLCGKAYTYLAKVRRMREGDAVPVLLPESGAAVMSIAALNSEKKEIILKKSPDKPAPQCIPPPAADIILLQWILKGAKTDGVIRQATEAGVRFIIPVAGEFSVAKKHNPAQLERYRRIIREARQQSGSSIDTEITEPLLLSGALEFLNRQGLSGRTVFGMCTESADVPCLSMHAFLAGKPACIVLAIGAEGGMSRTETDMLRSAGFQSLHFKTNVLRAETAALYAVAAAQTIINEADQWQLPESHY